MNKRKNICILGGSGFVGRRIVAQIVKQGYRVRVLSRHRERHRELLLLPGVEVISADVHDAPALKENFTGQDVVINLVGILNERRARGLRFTDAHVDLTRKVIDACQVKNVPRLLHMSALNADAEKAPSKYLRTKGQAEELLHNARDITATSFRPSVIFGHEDSFFNRFAGLLRLSPGFMPFPLACAGSRFAPVYVEDVATAFVKSIDNPATIGQRYNLCGPKVYTLKELVQYTASLAQLKRRIIALPNLLARVQAGVMTLLPGKLFTWDNFLSLQVDSVCEGEFPAEFGVKPTPLESVVPRYIGEQHVRGRYNQYRRAARR